LLLNFRLNAIDKNSRNFTSDARPVELVTCPMPVKSDKAAIETFQTAKFQLCITVKLTES